MKESFMKYDIKSEHVALFSIEIQKEENNSFLNWEIKSTVLTLVKDKEGWL